MNCPRLNLTLALVLLLLRTFVAGQAAAAQPQDQAAREVRVGVYENKPKIFTDEAGVVSGIFPAILEEIARKEQWHLTYVHCEWSACLEALAGGRIDLMPDVARSLKREAQFDFHKEEVASSWSVVYARRGSRMSSIVDLNGLRIAVLKGSIQQTTLAQMARGFGFTVAFVEATSFDEAFSLTAEDKADAVATNHFFGDSSCRRYGLKKTPIVFNPVVLYFATAPGANPGLLKAIDENLAEMKSNPGSVYYRTLARWMEERRAAPVPPYLFWTIGGISALLALAVLFILLLRWQVRVGTRDLVAANRKLHDSEEMFRDLFQLHTAVKLLIDPDTGAIVEANQAAEKFYGWSREQLQRLRIQDINTLPPEQVAAEMEKARSQQCSQFEFRHRLADGTVRDVAVFSSKIAVQGRPLLHSIVHDVSERRKLEEQLRQAQKMEAVGQLAGGVAHDYNNMLSVILGHAELALIRTEPSSPLHAHLTAILDAARRSAGITRQLLAFARKQDVAPRVLDLNNAVSEMLSMLRRLIGEDIDLSWLPASSLWPVKIDPGQVDQVLANLCVNARDSIAGTGRITIETGNVGFDGSYCSTHAGFTPGEYVLLAVSDNGCGMSKETLEHVFEPFFTTKGVGQGTGMGLATVYGIVRQNEGFINIYSEPGRGTTFKLYFPRHVGAIEAVCAGSAAPIPQACGEKVLLIEDDRAIRELTRTMLRDLGYQVVAAATPGEALRFADERACDFDLLVTDVIMPDMNGRELADRLQAACPKLKTLFMSGYTANIIARQGVFEEGVHFMQKPFTYKDLAVKVREALLNYPRSPENGSAGSGLKK